MDDFEYSVHISDQDWDGFFQECEGCDLLSPVLASREDSGMSDIDQMNCRFIGKFPVMDITSTKSDLDIQIDGPPDSEGSPVCNYLSRYGICSPEQVLSGSEDDLHLQAVNLFFEQLRSVTEIEQPLKKSQAVIRGSEVTDHLERLIDTQDTLQEKIIDTAPSGQNNSSHTAKQGVENTWCEKPIFARAHEDESKSDSELVIARKSWLSPLVPVKIRQEQPRKLCESCRDLEMKSDRILGVNRKVIPFSNPTRPYFDQLDPLSSSDSTVRQIPFSPTNLKRKRRRKKRTSTEQVEQGYESHLYVHPSESEDERFISREMMNSLAENIWKREQLALSGIKSSLTAGPADDLQIKNMFCPKAPADFNIAKSFPLSLYSDVVNTVPNPKENHTCSVTISPQDLQREQQTTEIPQLLSLPKMEDAFNLQESGLNTTESLHFNTPLHISESETIENETLLVPVVNNFDGERHNKCVLAPNIISVIDPAEHPHSLYSFDLTEDKSLTEDSFAIQNGETLSSDKIAVDILSMTESCLFLLDNENREESHLAANAPNTYSQGDLQNQELGIQTNISESQTNLSLVINETNVNVPRSETNGQTENDMFNIIIQRKDDDLIQSESKLNVVAVNGLPIPFRNLDESENRSNDENTVSIKSEQLSSPENKLGENPSQSALEFRQDITEESTLAEKQKKGTKDQESDATCALVHVQNPVFAMSSFWSEMEKLTINDILRLRLACNSQHTSIFTHAEDIGIMDTTDAADSGYFTQLDDSKPDRLSGDMSYISDLDEDLAQIQSQFDSKQDGELCKSTRSSGMTWENELEVVGLVEGKGCALSEATLKENLYAPNGQQSFRKMCKNVSVQNLRALDAHPTRKFLRNSSVRSFCSETEDDSVDPFYHVNTHSKVFSDDEDEGETSGITFSEIIQFIFGGDEPKRCESRDGTDSHHDGEGTSLPDTYDPFFSEFDAGDFVCPVLEQSGCDETVPIFSCSRSASYRNFQFPEAYDHFFPDSPRNSDDENENTAIKVVAQYDLKSSKQDPVDGYEHFYSDDESDILWMNPLSFRRVQRSAFAFPENEPSSGELVPVKRSSKGILTPSLCPDGSPFPVSMLLNLEDSIVMQLNEHQKTCLEIQTVIADPRLDVPFLPLKQADMCLVCIAFASWVLKSTGAGGDAWKAALLANVSALSAIRYLRRHKKEEVSGKASLPQTEPA